MIYRLVFLNGDSKGIRQTVEPSPMVIGTDEGCDVRIGDAEMARRHAMVEQKPDGLWISDLGTMNKILVNGHEVHETGLKHGDVVELGRTRFLVQAVVQAEFDVPPVAVGKKRRGPVFAVTACLLLAAAYGAYRMHTSRVPTPPSPTVDPGPVTNAPVADFTTTQILETAEIPADPAPATNGPDLMIVRPGRTSDTAEMQAVLRELKGLREAVTSMAERVTAATAMPERVVAVVPEPPAPVVAEPVVPVAPPRVFPPESPAARPTPNVQFGPVTQQRFPASDRFDEMRILRIGLTWAPDAVPSPADHIRLHVSFFEQHPENDAVVPSVIHEPSWVEVPADAWAQGTATVVTASYAVPRGMRAAAGGPGRVGAFHGYVIQICHGDDILATHARPVGLAALRDLRFAVPSE